MKNYPVRLVGVPDPAVSRGLWLVKWLLAVPHYIVLAFLWLAFAVLSVVAFFAILFTGRYPQAIFDFTTGVLRWSWRVGFYAYSALGTDRYPPFTLHDVPDYPARLIVDHPPRLSRGLVLVKWLLAVPHLVVVAVLLGGGPYLTYRIGDSVASLQGGGLIGVLVLIAAVVLLFTGRYPRDLFDLIIGLNRWTYRVAGYVFLMTDEYPPFRLDSGPGDDSTLAQGEPEPIAQSTARTTVPPAPAGAARRWTAGRVIGVVVGAVLLVVAFGAIPAGAAGLLLDNAGRDSSGYVATDLQRFTSPGYALRTSPGALRLTGPEWVTNRALGQIRVTGSSTTPLFIGIASSRDATAYLDGVEHSVVSRLDSTPTHPVYRQHTGGAPALPDTQQIWVAKASGSGQLTVDWTPRSGDWAVVVLNADGSRAVQADLGVGATLPWLDDLSFSLIGIGLLLLLGGAILIALSLRTRPRPVAVSNNQPVGV